MKILAFSDLHLDAARAATLVEASEAADLVIGAGDFCNMRKGLGRAMEMLAEIRQPVVLVPGNAESAQELRDAAPDRFSVLRGTSLELAGIRIFGFGYAVPPTPFGDWSCDLSEADAAEMLGSCDEADIMILHSPPKCVADITSRGFSLGSVAIRDAIQRVQPRLALCGHIHDSWGEQAHIGNTLVANLGPVPNWFRIA